MVKNKDIAERLGINPVSLSRLRSGERKPSLRMMKRIETELGWTMADQSAAYNELDRTSYASAFRRFLRDNFEIPNPEDQGSLNA